MPLLKGTAGKAMPDMAIGYITRKDKAKYIDVQNLFEDEGYAEQFKETAARFGKYTDYDERKYYHFKLSPDRKDRADPRMVHELRESVRGKDVRGLRVRHCYAYGYADRSQSYRGQCRPPAYGKETAF